MTDSKLYGGYSIEELRAIDVATLPAPWDFAKLNNRWAVYPDVARNDGVDYFIASTRALPGSKADTERSVVVAIAASRSALPALLAEVERLRAALAALRDDAYVPAFVRLIARTALTTTEKKDG